MNKSVLIIVTTIIVIAGGLYLFFKAKNKASVVNTLQSTSVATLISIPMSEIATHNTKENCWTTINGGVYDITKFISQHRGGDKILNACGVDATEFFTGKHPTIGRVHSQVAVQLLSGMKIGDLQK